MIPEDENEKNNPSEQPLKEIFEQKVCGGYVIKGVIVLLLLGGFLLYRIGFEMDFTSECIYDQGHETLWGINQLIDKDPNLTILLIGQWIMDICLIFIILFWYQLTHSGLSPSKTSAFP